jgi:hypothetical protein
LRFWRIKRNETVLISICFGLLLQPDQFLIFMKNIILFALLLGVFACSQRQQTAGQASPPAPVVEPAPSPADAPEKSTAAQAKPFSKEFTDGPVSFSANFDGSGKGRVKIAAETNNKRSFSREFEVEGQVQEAFLLDLDQDGFSELYLLMGNPDSPSIKGFSSYQNRSAGEILIKENDPAPQGMVVAKDGKLLRISPDNTTWTYELEKGETSFVLSPKQL